MLLFLIATTPGLALTLKLAHYFLPGRLDVETVHGQLLGHCSLGYLHYHDSEIDVTLKNVNLKWKILGLLDRKLEIQTFASQEGRFTIHPQTTAQHDAGSFAFPRLPLTVTLHDASFHEVQLVQNNTIHTFEEIKLQAQMTNRQWDIKQFNLNHGNISLEAKGEIQPVLPYAISAELKLTNHLNPNLPIKGFIRVNGDLSFYRWEGEVTNLNRTQPTTVTLHGTLRHGQELNTKAQWQDFIWPLTTQSTLNSNGQLEITGRIPKVTLALHSTINSPVQSEITLHAHTQAKGLKAQGLIQLAEGQVNFNLNYKESDLPKLKGNLQASTLPNKKSLILEDVKLNADFTGDSPDNLTFNTHLTANYLNTPLLANLLYQNQQLHARVNLGGNRLEINGTYPYQWQAKANLPKPHLLSPSLTGLDTIIIADASLSRYRTGQAHVIIKPGHYQFEEGNLSKLPFAGGQLEAVLTPQKLALNGKLTIDKDKHLAITLKLPNLQLDKKLIANQVIEGNLRLKVNSLNFLQNLSSEIHHLEGQLKATLEATGTLGKPSLKGKIDLTHGQISLPDWGLNFHTMQMHLQSQNKRWKTTGSLISNNKPLTLYGEGIFDPRVSGTLHLEGDNLTLINTPEYLINVSPKLLLEMTPEALNIKGTVTIPKAQIKPQSFTNSVSLSEDVVFEGQEKKATRLPVNTNIRLEMGEDVSLSVKGLSGALTGAIHLHQLSQEPLNATGDLTIKNGKYQAYGQDLTIDQGQLIFTGGSVLNPGLRVRAIRQFNNTSTVFSGSNQLLDFNTSNLQTMNFSGKTTVGIEVTGRLNSPKVELFSIPSTLSQADILSMLLLGRPASQANKAGGQLLLAAMSSMNLGSGANGTQLVEQLKQTLGVDVNLESNPQFDPKNNQITEKTSVVVGKSLSKRLYVSYNYGLAKTDSNVVTLTYLLNKFFSIQVNSSLAGSGIDLLYTHRKD
ncbi:translocation/assembly module TamB domain-containing protein [Legionella clemsonensis]|nr:translocation/assembly module TamB domain-containing protein [Legionella clemsonensis]